MPTFQYKALQTDGSMAEGQLEAPGRPDAFRQMEGLGLRPVSLSETGTGAGEGNSGLPAFGDLSRKLGAQRVSAKALENFTRLLSSFQYKHPAGKEPRPFDGKPDLGAYEFQKK